MILNITRVFALVYLAVAITVHAGQPLEALVAAVDAGDTHTARLLLNQGIDCETTRQLSAKQFYEIKLDCLSGDIPEFRRRLKALRSAQPDHPALDDLDFLDGQQALKKRDYSYAIDAFNRVAKQDSRYRAEALRMVKWASAARDYDAAVALYNSDHFADAQKAFLSFCDSHPSHPQAKAARFYYIKCFYMLNDFDAALSCIDADLGFPSTASSQLVLLKAQCMSRAHRNENVELIIAQFCADGQNASLLGEAAEILLISYKDAIERGVPGYSEKLKKKLPELAHDSYHDTKWYIKNTLFALDVLWNNNEQEAAEDYIQQKIRDSRADERIRTATVQIYASLLLRNQRPNAAKILLMSEIDCCERSLERRMLIRMLMPILLESNERELARTYIEQFKKETNE